MAQDGLAAERSSDPSSRDLSVRAAAGAVATTGASMLPVTLLGALIVQIRADIAISTVELGLSIAIFSGVSALMSIPSGRLLDRLGWIRGVWLAGTLLAIPMLALGTMVTTYSQVAVMCAVAGLGNAVAQPAANLAIMRSVRTERQGFAFGMKQAAVPAGSALAGFAVPIIALTVGWQWAFIAAAALILVLCASSPWAHRGPIMGSGGALRLASIMGDPALLLLAVANFTSAMGLNALFAFLVEASVARGIEPATAGLLLALAGGAGALSRLVVGYFADRFPRAPEAILNETAIYAMIGVTGMFVLGARGTTVPAIALGLLLAVGFGFAWSGQLNLVVTRVWRTAPAAATGVTQSGLWIGGMLGPLTFGFVAANVSYEAAFYVGGTFMTMTGVFMLLARRLLLLRARQAA